MARANGTDPAERSECGGVTAARVCDADEDRVEDADDAVEEDNFLDRLLLRPFSVRPVMLEILRQLVHEWYTGAVSPRIAAKLRWALESEDRVRFTFVSLHILSSESGSALGAYIESLMPRELVQRPGVCEESTYTLFLRFLTRQTTAMCMSSFGRENVCSLMQGYVSFVRTTWLSRNRWAMKRHARQPVETRAGREKQRREEQLRMELERSDEERRTPEGRARVARREKLRADTRRKKHEAREEYRRRLSSEGYHRLPNEVRESDDCEGTTSEDDDEPLEQVDSDGEGESDADSSSDTNLDKLSAEAQDARLLAEAATPTLQAIDASVSRRQLERDRSPYFEHFDRPMPQAPNQSRRRRKKPAPNRRAGVPAYLTPLYTASVTGARPPGL